MKILLDSSLFRSHYHRKIEIDKQIMFSPNMQSISREVPHAIGALTKKLKDAYRLKSQNQVLKIPIVLLKKSIYEELTKKKNEALNFKDLEVVIDQIYITDFINKPFHKIEIEDDYILVGKENELLMNVSFFFVNSLHTPELIESIYNCINNDKNISKKIPIKNVINISDPSNNRFTRLAFEFKLNESLINITIYFNNPIIQRLRVLSKLCFESDGLYDKSVNYQTFWLIHHWFYQRDFIVSNDFIYKYYNNNSSRPQTTSKINFSTDVLMILYIYFLEKHNKIRKLGNFNLDEYDFSSFAVQTYYNWKDFKAINMKRYFCYDLPNTTVKSLTSSTMQIGELFISFIYFLYDMCSLVISEEAENVQKKYYLDVFSENLSYETCDDKKSSLIILDYFFNDDLENISLNDFSKKKEMRVTFDTVKKTTSVYRSELFTINEYTARLIVEECKRAVHYCLKQDFNLMDRIFFKNKKC